MVVKSKLNSTETLVSQELVDIEISREEFITILKEKDKYEKMKKQCEECEWEIRRKTWKNEVKLKDLKKWVSDR